MRIKLLKMLELTGVVHCQDAHFRKPEKSLSLYCPLNKCPIMPVGNAAGLKKFEKATLELALACLKC